RNPVSMRKVPPRARSDIQMPGPQVAVVQLQHQMPRASPGHGVGQTNDEEIISTEDGLAVDPGAPADHVVHGRNLPGAEHLSTRSPACSRRRSARIPCAFTSTRSRCQSGLERARPPASLRMMCDTSYIVELQST